MDKDPPAGYRVPPDRFVAAVTTGFPTTAAEYLLDSSYLGIAQLASLVLEGVCERFPELRIVLSGFGAGWLPSLVWRFGRRREAT